METAVGFVLILWQRQNFEPSMNQVLVPELVPHEPQTSPACVVVVADVSFPGVGARKWGEQFTDKLRN